jgi:uncharacterized protein (DUF58 family)
MGLLGGAALLFFLGTNVQSGWLFVLAAFLGGTVVSGAFLAGRMVRGIEVERRSPEEVHQGDEALVELAVTNRSGGLRVGLTMDDTLVAPASIFVGAVRPGERVELSTARTATHRGPQEAPPVTLRSSGPFGVAERRRRVDAYGRTLVLPKVVRLGRLPFVERTSTSERAQHTAPRRGGGPEYLGVREYRPGDSMRHVHWPSTARQGTVMVREFEQEHTRRLAILVDTLTDAGDPLTPLDACCCAAASIASAAAADGQGVRLLAAGAARVEVTAHADGRELERRLATLVPAGLSLADLAPSLGEALRGVESVVVIFPTWWWNAPETLVPALASLGSFASRIVAVPVVAAPARVGSLAMTPDGVTSLVAGLRGVGIETLPWEPERDLAEALGARETVVA